MKRFFLMLAVFFCCVALTIPVSARSAAEQIRSEATVTADGDCTVTLTATFSLDEAVEDPIFPIPANASDVTLNGGKASGKESGQAQLISLKNVTGGMAGKHSITIRYTLSAVVTTTEENGLILTLPLLSGLAYPVDSMEFSVTLPGPVPATPDFTSSYYQEHIQSLLDISVNGSTVRGTAKELKDHESLTMTLPVDETLFPQTAVTARVLGMMDIAILAAVVLALIYYFAALCPKPTRRVLRTTAPDGISAGDTSVWLTGGKTDLSLLVVTWAQLGYLRIQVDDNGRVLLHKRMDMGNERSVFENRCYKNLFGRRRIVDGTGYHYAQLCREVAKKAPPLNACYRAKSGNPKIFRILCAVPALLSGISLAAAMAPNSIFLRVLFACLCAVMALFIQSGGACLPTRHKLPLYIGLGCSVVWMGFGLGSGEWVTALLMIAFQFLSGLAAAFGGRRTELGQQALGQILGLRRHMRTVSKKELQRLLKVNPGYFHELAPYALALDADRSFARRFGRLRLPECTYLICGMRGQMTAAEWARMLRATVQTLDARAKRLPLEKITNR